MGRPRGCLWLTTGLLVALVAGVVAFMALSRATAQQAGAVQEVELVDVVVATGQTAPRTILSADMVRVKQMPVSAVPEGALQQVSQAEGMLTAVELFPDEVLLAPRLIDPNITAPDGRTALLLDGDKVLMAYPANDLLSQVGVLQAGDHVDLLVTLTFPIDRTAVGVYQEDRLTSFGILQNLSIAAIVGGPTDVASAAVGDEAAGKTAVPPALLLTVSPQDALTLKYVIDAGGKVDVVLRAPGAEGPFAVEPVDWNYLIDKYKIPTGSTQ